MTEPAKYVHDAIAGKPTLKASKSRNRHPYGQTVPPINFAHRHLLSLNIPTLKGFVNG